MPVHYYNVLSILYICILLSMIEVASISKRQNHLLKIYYTNCSQIIY